MRLPIMLCVTLPLRTHCSSSPLRYLQKLAASFDAVLKDVAERCGKRTSFDAKAVKINPLEYGPYPCAVIELPEPKEVAEAYMVALVVPLDTESDTPPDAENIKGRFFTLEKGLLLPLNPELSWLNGMRKDIPIR